MIKIDYYFNDDFYGDFVWVNIKVSSCSEMIVEFVLMFFELFKMNVEVVWLFYVGIVGDIGCFLYFFMMFCILEIVLILRNYLFDVSVLNREIE